MIDYVSFDEARKASGLRLVLAPGRPGGWTESAKNICHVKKLSYVAAAQEVNSENVELREWTAQTAAPVAIWNDEPPRSAWIEQLFLFERISPSPPLIPVESENRVLMFGLASELACESGFGWSKRLMIIHDTLTNPDSTEQGRDFATNIGKKYGYTPAKAEAAPARCAEILRTLGRRLEQQRERGSQFFIGTQLTALDIYWASFAALVRPLPHELCPMTPAFRAMYTNTDPVVQDALSPALLEHRDFIYRTYLKLPVEL